MLDQHRDTGAGVTVAGIRTPIEEAPQFGVIQPGDTSRVDAFLEKPAHPEPLADDPSRFLASMGSYIFETSYLIDLLNEDSMDDGSKHDIGGNLIPKAVAAGAAHVYDFADNEVPGPTASIGAIGGMSGPSTPTSRRPWISSNPSLSSISTTTSGRSTRRVQPLPRRRWWQIKGCLARSSTRSSATA